MFQIFIVQIMFELNLKVFRNCLFGRHFEISVGTIFGIPLEMIYEVFVRILLDFIYKIVFELMCFS